MGGVMEKEKIQEAYEKTVLTEVWRDFDPDDRKNRQFTKLLVKDLVDALITSLNLEHAAKLGAESGALKGLNVKTHYDKIRKAIKAGEKWLK
jgi:hypothetical protein